jgi:beta-ureidopropionase
VRVIEPYNAVGLIPTFWGIRERADIANNLEHLESLTTAAFWLSNLDIPVRLLVIPEGALQGFNDEILDADHVEFAHHCAIDVPGPETDRLGALARRWGVHVMAQAKARHPEWPDLFFNVGLVISPEGEILLVHYKLNALLPVERSVSPHDLFDWWIERYGRTLDAFWPVADTALGRLGVMMAMEGNFPENGRGLALNGAEVVYRASLPAPFTENDVFEISNRARAMENNFYVVAPNIGGYHLYPDSPHAIDAGGGRSMIVNHRGQIVGKQFDTNGPRPRSRTGRRTSAPSSHRSCTSARSTRRTSTWTPSHRTTTSTAARSSRPRSRCSRTATCGAARERRHRATSRPGPPVSKAGGPVRRGGGGGVARPRSPDPPGGSP